MTALTDRLTSAVAGRYRLERHIGENGMATVYIHHDAAARRGIREAGARVELVRGAHAYRWFEVSGFARLE